MVQVARPWVRFTRLFRVGALLPVTDDPAPLGLINSAQGASPVRLHVRRGT